MVDNAHAYQGPTCSGTVSVPSALPFGQTVERLEGAVKAAGLTLFAVVDHSGGAHEAGLSMRDTTLLLFGNPRAGTPAMVASPLLALELPLKALVWVDERDQVQVSYQDSADLGRRYQVPAELMEPLSRVGQLVAAALKH